MVASRVVTADVARLVAAVVERFVESLVRFVVCAAVVHTVVVCAAVVWAVVARVVGVAAAVRAVDCSVVRDDFMRDARVVACTVVVCSVV